MSFLFGSKQPEAQANKTQNVTGVPVQTSAFGGVVPILYGTQRAAINCIFYGDFTATQQQNDAAGGAGKGGIFGSPAPASPTYTYSAAFAFAICEGPIAAMPGTVWQSKAVTTLSALGFSTFLGTYPQTPWGYLTTNHPSQARGYNGFAYIAAANYQLGTTAEMPNHSILVQALLYDAAISSGDSDASRIMVDILTSPHYSNVFPASRIAALTNYQNYTRASGLVLSPGYGEQRSAADIVNELCLVTNSAARFSSGVLDIVPYGDEAVSGHGFSYVPPATPQYDLGDDDFFTDSPNDDPVKLLTRRPSDIVNSIKIEFRNRAKDYNVDLAQAKDQARIDAYGLIQNAALQQHLLCDPAVAQLSAHLQLQRLAVPNDYEFMLDQRYALLEVMDIVSLTDSVLGLDHQWVRISEISERDDGILQFKAEEYLGGAGTSAQYSFQPSTGFQADYSQPPGDINAPVIFEPTSALSQGLYVYFGISGSSVEWGGCEVWAADDSAGPYRLLGQVNGKARMGTIGGLPAFTAVAGGQTIDQTNTLHVDLSQSSGDLMTATQADARAYNTLLYVGGEFISYGTATLTSSNQYDLTYLVRGSFSTFPVVHAAGEPVVRIDSGLFKWPYSSDRIGQTLYFKFPSFNRHRGGLQSLSSVGFHAYTLTGIGATPMKVAFDNLTAQLQSYIAFQVDGAQQSADFAAFAHDRAIFAQQDAVARVKVESDTRQDADQSIASQITTVSAALSGEISARGDAVQTLASQVTSVAGSVTVISGSLSDITARLDSPTLGLSALASAQNTLSGRVGIVEGAVSAQATSLSQVQTTVNGVTNTVQQEITARTNFDGSMTGYWAVRMSQENGTAARFSGVRLISTTGVDSTQLSQFIFEIDKILFAPPGGVATAVLVPGTVNGGAYFGLRGDMVIDGSLTGTKIAAQTITSQHIQVGSLTGDRIAAQTLTANNFQADAALYQRTAFLPNTNFVWSPNAPCPTTVLLNRSATILRGVATVFMGVRGSINAFAGDTGHFSLYINSSELYRFGSFAAPAAGGVAGVQSFMMVQIPNLPPGNHLLSIVASGDTASHAVGTNVNMILAADIVVSEPRNLLGSD